MLRTSPINRLVGTIIDPLWLPGLAATDISLWELLEIKHIGHATILNLS
jgi:hypothetical protein